MRTALVLGSQGALGKAVVNAFSNSGQWVVLGVDVASPASPESLAPAVKLMAFTKPNPSIEEMQADLLAFVSSAQSAPLSAVINVAGGWAGGSVKDATTAAAAELMLRQSLFSSFAAAHVFATRGAPGGLLALTGAAAAVQPTPGMLGCGTAKSAVHFLCRSIAADPTALPKGAKAVAVLPTTIDTPGNRAAMPDADTAAWTPSTTIADQLLAWSTDTAVAPPSGTLMAVETKNNKTSFQPIS